MVTPDKTLGSIRGFVDEVLEEGGPYFDRPATVAMIGELAGKVSTFLCGLIAGGEVAGFGIDTAVQHQMLADTGVRSLEFSVVFPGTPTSWKWMLQVGKISIPGVAA